MTSSADTINGSVLSGTQVGVLGGGRMGAGIAHAFLLAGAQVAVVDREDQLNAANGRVTSALEASIRRGTTSENRDALTERLTVTADAVIFTESTLVVEAVPELLDLKQDSLRRIEAVVDKDAIVASNTSSISIDALAAVLTSPGRFLGMHFFNPVPASSLVEVVRGAVSEESVVTEAQRFVAAIGKTPVTVNNAPGFASSRLGVAIGLEAIRMLEEGVASADDIDNAMVLGYRFPVGPLRLTDIVGLDVRLDIAEYLHGQLGERFAPPQLLREKVAAGQLGRKSGQGFFSWEAE